MAMIATWLDHPDASTEGQEVARARLLQGVHLAVIIRAPLAPNGWRRG